MTLSRLICLTLVLFSQPQLAFCSHDPKDEMVPGHSRKRVPVQPIEHLTPPPSNKSLKDASEGNSSGVVAAVPAQRVPIVRIRIPPEMRAAMSLKAKSDLLLLPPEILINIFLILDDCQHQTRLARTCTTLNKLLLDLPIAPRHFLPVIFRGIHPQDRAAIPISEFVKHFSLYTTKGRRDFLNTFTVDGFVEMVKGDRHKGYLLGKPYVAAREVTRKHKNTYEVTGRTAEVLLDANFFLFPPEFCDLDFLGSISFRDWKIVALPPDIGRLDRLDTILVTSGFLRSIPESIGSLTLLAKLNLGHNFIARLPDSMSRLTALTDLNLEDNMLSEIPPCLIELTGLTTLNLSQNRIARIPPSITRMVGLKSLYLSNETPLRTDDERENMKPPRVFITALPFEMGYMKNLEKLYLGGNKLKELPYSFNRMTSLQELDLSSNLLENIPSELFHLCGLKRLDFRDTPICDVSVQLTRLTKLVHLNIRGTSVIDVPPEVKQMPELTELVQDEEFLI